MNAEFTFVIVDDNPICSLETQMVINNYMRGSFKVASYCSAGDFISHLHDFKQIDLLLVDFQMPAIDGLELINMIIGTPLIKKISILSGWHSLARLDIPKGVHVCTKPLNSAQLERVLA